MTLHSLQPSHIYLPHSGFVVRSFKPPLLTQPAPHKWGAARQYKLRPVYDLVFGINDAVVQNDFTLTIPDHVCQVRVTGDDLCSNTA